MTPKEKAKELYFKMHSQNYIISVEAKQCALIAVDEIIKELERCFIHNEYWQEVKQEIEKL
jgi:hypothetical protein